MEKEERAYQVERILEVNDREGIENIIRKNKTNKQTNTKPFYKTKCKGIPKQGRNPCF